MATLLTVNTTPLAINPAYREVLWQVTSTDANIVAVRADVYINSVYTSTIDAVQQLGFSDRFDIDIRKIMQSRLVSELRTNITTLQISDAITSAAEVKIRLFEVVLTAGVHTHTWLPDGAGTNFLEDGDYNVVNMATQHQETLSDWTVESSAKKLLTLRTDNNRIPKGVPFQIGFLSATANLQVRVIELDANLNTLNTFTSATEVGILYSKGIMEIPASVMADANVAFLDIRLQNSVGPTAHSQTIRYKVVDYCNEFPLFWQNHLGGFDHYDFSAAQTLSISTKNQLIKKPLPSGFSSEDVGESVVRSKVSEKRRLITTELSSGELTFLENLIKNHSVVFEWQSAGVFLSHIVSSHSRKTEDNIKLVNTLQVTLKPANEHIVQLGD